MALAGMGKHLVMIVLVGANGFLGRHTCELLERRRLPAMLVSRAPDREFIQDFAPSLNAMSAAEFASGSGDRIIAQARAIIYFNWCSFPATFVDEPSRELSENVQPAFAFFMRVANISNRTKVVFLSSGGTVYGPATAEPRSETAETRPISSYGLGKLMAEKALEFVGRTTGLPYSILRISNTVGRWQTSNVQGIVSIALRSVRDGMPVRLFGGGGQVRDFVDADDAAEAILAACLSERGNSTWNVGSGTGISIVDLVQRISEIVGRPILISHAPSRKVDVPHLVLDCRKIARDLNWTAKTTLDESIDRCWRSVAHASPPIPRLVGLAPVLTGSKP